MKAIYIFTILLTILPVGCVAPSMESHGITGDAEREEFNDVFAEGNGDVVEPLLPEKITREGDYEIEQYDVMLGDLLEFRIRGIYRVLEINKTGIVLKPVPPIKQGILPSPWRVPNGESSIGNHHYVMVTITDSENLTAEVSIRYKVNFHWYDAFSF